MQRRVGIVIPTTRAPTSTDTPILSGGPRAGVRRSKRSGRRRSTRIREGAPWLKTGLVQAAWAATRVKGIHLRAKFHRIKSRRGAGKAAIAVAASILGAVFHILKNRVPYKELGDQPRDQKSAERAVQALKRKIEGFGFEVELKPAA